MWVFQHCLSHEAQLPLFLDVVQMGTTKEGCKGEMPIFPTYIFQQWSINTWWTDVSHNLFLFPNRKSSHLNRTPPQFHPISKSHTQKKKAVTSLKCNRLKVAGRDENKHFWTYVQLAAVTCRENFIADIKCSLWSSFYVSWRLKKWMTEMLLI